MKRETVFPDVTEVGKGWKGFKRRCEEQERGGVLAGMGRAHGFF